MAWLFFAACGSGPTVADLEELDPDLFTSSPTYTNDIKPLLEKYCVACHDSTGFNDNGRSLDTYENVTRQLEENLCTAITEEVATRFNECGSGSRRRGGFYSMPTGAKSRMTLPEQVLFARWVDNQAPK